MIEKIKKLTLKALMNDEELMYGLVLKGGNALQMVYEITDRASMDIDFSIEGDFSQLDFERIHGTLDALLNQEFQGEGLVAFDVRFFEKPKTNAIKVWKGYSIEFKVTDRDRYDPDNIEKTRREAYKIVDQSTRFTVDISSFEYIKTMSRKEVDGTILNVYTPEMIVLEKVRALCQSMPEYKDIVPSAKVKGRARDYYDIWNICQHYDMDFSSEENKALVREIFNAKNVPMDFLELLPGHKDYQRENWNSVVDTLSADNEGFDFYYDFTMQIVAILKTP